MAGEVRCREAKYVVETVARCTSLLNVLQKSEANWKVDSLGAVISQY